MLNHKDREEVQEALASGIGLAERMSDTLSEKTFYFALRLDNGDILRVARTTDSVLRRWPAVFLYDRGSAGGGFGGYASGTADY